MIVCPSLPKKYIEDAMKALNTDKQITVEASYVQWLQNHPDEDRLPSMEELKEFNTELQPESYEKTFAEQLAELHDHDTMRIQMLKELSADEIYEYSQMIQLYYNNVVENTLMEAYNDPKKAKLLSGNKWQDKAEIVKRYTPNNIMKQVKAAIAGYFLNDEFLKDTYDEEDIPVIKQKANQIIKYFDQLIPYAASLLKSTQPIPVMDVETSKDDIFDSSYDEETIDDSTMLEHWQIEHLETSVFSTLDPITKDVINSITDDEATDSFGNTKTKDARTVSKKLIDVISKITYPKEMIPALIEETKTTPWMSQVIDLLCGRNTETYKFYPDNISDKDLARKAQNLQALFWHDFHKPFLTCATLSRDGGFQLANTKVQDNVQLQSIQDHIQSQDSANPSLIYKNEGTLNEDGYNRSFDLLRHEGRIYKFFEAEDRDKVSRYQTEIGTLTDIINSVGVTVSKEDVERLFRFGKPEEITKLQNALFKNFFNERKSSNSALNGLKSNPTQSVFSAFYKSYKMMAEIFKDASVNEDENRFITEVDGDQKVFYSNVVPNVIITMMSKYKQSPQETKKFIEDNYLYDFHYMSENGKIPNIWLRELYRGDVTHNAQVEPIQLVSSYGVSYMRESNTQSALTRLETFFTSKATGSNNNEYALYSVGTFADAKSSYYIRNKVRSMEDCIAGITDMFISEIDRIAYVRAKKNAIDRTTKAVQEATTREEHLKSRADRRYEIENFDRRDYFLIFPNIVSSKILGPSANIQEATQKVLDTLRNMNPVEKQEFCKSLVTEQLRESFKKYSDYIQKLGITFSSPHQEITDRLGKFTTAESFNNDLASYYLNQFLANLCIDNMLCVDYAYFKHSDDKQKRFKMFYSPYQTAYTSLYLYDKSGEVKEYNIDVSRDDQGNAIEYFLLLKDNEAPSLTKDMILGALKERVGTYLTPEQYRIIVKGLDDINVSDGQAFRSLPSWRNIMNMIGQGQDDRTQKAIEKILNGTWDYEAYQCAFNVWKPFVSSYMKVDTGITAEDFQDPNMTPEKAARYSTLKVPTMHKNSEFLLLAMYPQIQGIVRQSPKLRAINRFMSDFGIDKAQFESANKVGNHGAINLNNETRGTYEEGQFKDDDGNIITPSENQIYIDQNTGNAYGYRESTGYVQIDYEDYIYKQLCLTCGLDIKQPHRILYNQGYNNNIIHSEPLDNWGIITNLPEHLLDHETGGLGTQSMKIITEDTPKNAHVEFNLNGVNESMTGEEALDVYQHILADYVLKAFSKIDSKFNNPVNLRKFIRKSLANQVKAPQNLDDCLEIDESTGKFKISPINPIRNMQFLSFCASLIRKEMIRRNVKQGLLPQVSNYGLEDALLLRYQNDDGHIIFTQKEFAGNAKVDKRHTAWLSEMQDKYSTYRDYRNSAEGKGTRILYLEVAMPLYDNGLKQFVDKETGHFDVNAFERVVSPEAREAFGYRTPTEAKHSMVPIYIKEFMPFQNSSCVMMAMDWIFLSGSDMDSDKLFTFFPELEFKTSKATGEVIEVRPKEFNVSGEGSLHDKLISSIPNNDTASNNNLLLWLMRGLLQTKENLSHVMTPNGFDNIRKDAKIMKLLNNPGFKVFNAGTTNFEKGTMAKSDYKALLNKSLDEIKKISISQTDSLSPADPTLRVIEQTKNMVGLQSIAIFAVFRAFAPLLQKTETFVKEQIKDRPRDLLDRVPFILNGNKSITDSRINREQNLKNQFVTDIDTELIGTSVDNAKDPLLNDLGIDLELVPYAIFLIARGYPTNEIALLFNQPVIKDIIFEFNLTKGQRSLRQIIREKRKVDFDATEIPDISRLIQLNQEDLALAINKEARMKTSEIDMSQATQQYVVLRMFEKLIADADQLNEVASLCRNSTVGGAIASMEGEMLSKYLQYRRARERYSKDAPILGLWDLIGGGIDLFEDTLRNNVLLKSDQLMHNVSFMLGNNFRAYIDTFTDTYLNGGTISVPELNNIKRFTQSYMYALQYLDIERHTPPHMELLKSLNNFTNLAFDMNNPLNSNESVAALMLVGVPKLISILKNRKVLTGPNELLSLLAIQSNKATQYQSFVRVLGNKNNPDTLEGVRRAWQALYDNYDEEHTIFYKGHDITFTNKDIADLLFLYNIQTTGIMPKFNNFIDAFPIGYEAIMPKYNETCEFLETGYLSPEILQEYIKNNASTTAAVHKISFRTFKNILGMSDNMEVLPSQLKVYTRSDAYDYFSNSVGNAYQYIGVGDESGTTLYELDRDNTLNGITAYRKVDTKGIHNTLNEYFGETIVPANRTLEMTPIAASTLRESIDGANIESISETSSHMLSRLFGENIEASIINIDKVTSKEVDETGIRICATIK